MHLWGLDQLVCRPTRFSLFFFKSCFQTVISAFRIHDYHLIKFDYFRFRKYTNLDLDNLEESRQFLDLFVNLKLYCDGQQQKQTTHAVQKNRSRST